MTNKAEELQSLIIGALLHDIGKLVQRASDNPREKTHQEFGYDYLESNSYLEDIYKPAKYHHEYQEVNPNLNVLNSNHLSSFIICEADSLAAGADRRKTNNSARGWDNKSPLFSVFNMVEPVNERGLSFKLCAQKEISNGKLNDLQKTIISKIPYPSEKNELTSGEYLRIKKLLDEALKPDLSPDRLLNILECYTSYITSDTANEGLSDISLFDHLKLTAAISSCMYLNITNHGQNNFNPTQDTYNKIIKNRQEERYLLVGGDLSGIQNFIYTISSKGALKSLRARSFYLELISEVLVYKLIDSVKLSRANIIFSGGGGFYLIMPNTDISKEAINQIKDNFNSWLLDEFGGKLFAAIDYLPFTGEDLMSKNIMPQKWSKMSEMLNELKNQRFRSSIEKLLMPEIRTNQENECLVCHRDDIKDNELKAPKHRDNTERWCPSCRAMFILGENLPNANYISLIKSNTYNENVLKIQDYEIHTEIEHKDKADILFEINNVLPDDESAINLKLGNLCKKDDEKPDNFMDFSDLSNKSFGLNRIGVLRADVDNLGKLFSIGIKENCRTFARMASVSRQLSDFFKVYLNNICEKDLGSTFNKNENKYEPIDFFSITGNKDSKKSRNVSIIYSGGDDLFIVGAWNDTIELAIDIDRCFKKYTCNKLSLSAGFIIQKSNFPLYQMAELAKDAEDTAKKIDKKKNAIAVFFNPNLNSEKDLKNEFEQVYKWNVFETEVINIVKEYLNLGKKDSECFNYTFSSSFLYKLYSISDLWRKQGKFYLPKLAYALARSKPKDENYQEKWDKFKTKVYNQKMKNTKTVLTWVELLSRKGEE